MTPEPIRLGIFGFPVAHSKSPAMHHAAARALGIDLEYARFEVAPQDLVREIERRHADRIDGYNVTVPHKQAVMACLDHVEPQAAAIGAVNTVVRSEGRYQGHNTDAQGLVRALQEREVSIENARIVVLGAGGAARAAVAGLADAGAGEIAVLARRPEQSEALVEALAAHVSCPLESASLAEASWHFDSATLVVQATSATLGSNPRAKEFAEALPIDSLPTDAVVFDMVYDPIETSVLARAAAHGLRTVDGLGMLVHQGALAFEMWTGFEAPLDAMRNALLASA